LRLGRVRLHRPFEAQGKQECLCYWTDGFAERLFAEFAGQMEKKEVMK
jgi:hypothetical protein